MRARHRILLFTLVFALGATAAHAQRSWDHEQVVEERFTVREGEVLTLRADLGAVVLRGTAGRDVVVRVVKGSNERRREAEALFARYDVQFERTRSGIGITGTYDRPGRTRWGNNRLGVRYEIAVPHAYNVDLATSGGSIRVADLRGDVKARTAGGSLVFEAIDGAVAARTSGGSITADGIADRAELHTSGGSISVRDTGADLDLHTSGGSITVENVAGEVTARTSGGSIRLADIGGAVDAQTSGGSVTADLRAQPERAMTLKTSGGSVTLVLPRGTGAELDARASGGRVRTDIPVRGTIERASLRGDIGGGGPLVTLRSSGGSVSIRER